MGRLSLIQLQTSLFLIMTLLLLAKSQSVSIVSTSQNVGDTPVNYTFVFSNVSSLTTIEFNFGSWSFLTQNPYSGSTKCYLFTSAITTSAFPSNQIQCSMTATGVNQSLNITLTNMVNPSSTKPYLINITLTNSTGSLNISTQLTMTTIPNSPITIKTYSKIVGATSSSIQMDIIMGNYIDSSTFLSLNYNSTLINISFPSTSSYTVLQNSNGTALISSWTNLSSYSGQLFLTNIAITNPLAAITYAITGTFYIKSGNITYNIQTVSATLIITPTTFSSLTVASPLSYGALSTLSISSSCNYTQLSNSNVSTAYTAVDFPTELKPTNASDCVATSTSTCQHSKLISSYTLSNFQVGIGSFKNTSLTFTSYTFYKGNYYSLCKSTVLINSTYQSISPNIATGECDSVISSLSNVINFYVSVQSVASGDEVYINGFKGVITNNWTQTTINSSLYYKYSLTSSNIVNSSSVTIPLSYNNPNQTTSNSITQFNIYRGSNQYTAMANSSLALCPITTGRTISTYSIIPTSLFTYDRINITISLTMQIYDYAWNDYLIIQFNSSSNGRQYFLAGALLGITPNLTVNGVYCSFSIVNDFTINITLNNNVSLPSIITPTLTIILINLFNPPAIDNYWLVITTIDQPTGGTKEIATTSVFTIKQNSLTYALSNLYLLKNNSLTLSITNANRLILAKNNSSAITTLGIVLPSTLKCASFTNNTIAANWNVGILTSNGSVSGTSTNLLINLGSCYVSYFNSTIGFTITQLFNSVQSTSTAVTLTNICGSTCYECSTSCTNCFNATYSSLNFLWQGQCYGSCPNGSYLSNSSCIACHNSCSSCNGNLFTNCTSCSSNYILSSGYCQSACGSGKYESSGGCISCHPNCESCLSYSVCYVCETGAAMIGTECQYINCTSPCSACFGSQSSCTSCIGSKIVYQSQCYDSCPSGTYLVDNGGVKNCSVISQSNSYVPVTITGIILITIIIILRAYSSKKIGNQSRRKSTYVQDDGQINYKINIIRVTSVIFAYLQLIAAIIVVLKNGIYLVGSSAMVAISVGLVFHFLSNLTFLIAFLKIIGKKKISNENQGQGNNLNENGENSENLYIRYRVIFVLSFLFTFKTYKLLFSNIFLDRKLGSSFQVRKQLEDSQNGINIKPAESNKIESTNRKGNLQNIKIGKLNQQTIPSRKPIRSNSLGDQHPFPIIQSTNSIKIQDPNSGENKFAHPFLTYLTIINIVLATLLIIIGSILEIMKSQFTNMLFWGLDCLIVTSCSLGMTSWDLWIFANLFHNEQHSEMSSRGEVNNTHENLKQIADIDIKIDPEPKDGKGTKSPKKSFPKAVGSSPKAKLSQRAFDKQESMQGVRAQIKRQCDQQTVARHQNIPILKVFDDFDQKDENVLNQKKTKKFSTKNLKKDKRYNSRKTNQTSHRRKNAFGQVCDDLYINFAANERQTQHNGTSYIQSRPSNSPNRSLQQQSIQVGGQFQDQPPNFADISDIEQGMPEPINISVSSELVPNIPKLRQQDQNL